VTFKSQHSLLLNERATLNQRFSEQKKISGWKVFFFFYFIITLKSVKKETWKYSQWT